MRHAHDWGRALGRPRTTVTVRRKRQLGLALLTASIVTVACDQPTSVATPADGLTDNSGADTRLLESTRSVSAGVAYPLVTVTPGTANMTVGQTARYQAHLSEPGGNTWTACCVTWHSSDSTIVSITTTGYGVTAGDVGIAIAHRPGKATISATTQSSTTGALTITVASGSSPAGSSGNSGGSSGGSPGGTPPAKPPTAGPPPSPPPAGSGSTHEPAGMTRQINTGAITSTSAVTMYSPSYTTATGEWSGNLTTVPGGTGLRLTYRPSLVGGNSPVRFGFNISSAGSGWYYQRMKIRLSSNWTLNGNVDFKLCEPRTKYMGNVAGPYENDVIALHDFESLAGNAFPYVALQGPYANYRNLTETPQYSSAANLRGGAWHTLEVLFAPESSPGAKNGGYTAWVDGVQIAHYTNVGWLAAGNSPGWTNLTFDPTYGGGYNRPPSTMYWDFDQLYVSTR